MGVRNYPTGSDSIPDTTESYHKDGICSDVVQSNVDKNIQ